MTEKIFEEHFSLENITSIYKERIEKKAGRGIDGVNTSRFSDEKTDTIEKIQNKVLSGKYRFTPYLEISKSKGRDKSPRIISKPTIRDKLTLSITKNVLHEIFPASVDRRLPNTFIREINDTLCKEGTEGKSFLKIDIKAFYNSIERGVPQGLSISNILASLYMHDFDKHFISKKINYVRYVDDILIIVKTEDLKKTEAMISDQLSKINLESNDKSDQGLLSKEFEYLGYTIKHPKITVRDSTVEKFISTIAALFTDIKYNAERRERASKTLGLKEIKYIFMLRINEKITGAISDGKRYGWIFYFLEINDMHLLHKMDHIIRSFFSRLEIFDNKPPPELKSLARSYYEAKLNTLGGYIHNYDYYDNREKKSKYLIDCGYLTRHEEDKYSDSDIDRKFFMARKKHLVKLEEDVANMS